MTGPEPPSRIPAVGYVRTVRSTRRRAPDADQQIHDVVDLLTQRNGLHAVAAPLVDDDATAKDNRKKRPGFETLLAMIAAGAVKVVVAWSWERLTRNLRDEVRLIEAASRGRITILLVHGRDLDLSTASDRTIADDRATVARLTIEAKAAPRVKANRSTAELGEAMKGRRPFGYEQGGMTLHPSEARLVADAYRWLLDGASLSSIATALNSAGARTTVGGEFTYKAVRQLLANPRNVGIRAYTPSSARHEALAVGETRGELASTRTRHYPAKWPRIVEPDVYERAMSILASRSSRRSPAVT